MIIPVENYVASSQIHDLKYVTVKNSEKVHVRFKGKLLCGSYHQSYRVVVNSISGGGPVTCKKCANAVLSSIRGRRKRLRELEVDIEKLSILEEEAKSFINRNS